MMKTIYSRTPLISRYRNGNYTVSLYADGTKIKHTEDDCFIAQYPDSIDLKITDFCDIGCPMCHESSSEAGMHGDLTAPFMNTLNAGTELAIGGGNALAHPDLDEFLLRMKARGVICNLTVNESHFLRSVSRIEKLLSNKLIYGLGISIKDCDSRTVEFAQRNGNAIFHLICGVAGKREFEKLADKNLKILLLGYKWHGRGECYFGEAVQKNIMWLRENIVKLSESFAAVCFDNAALEQLKIRDKISKSRFDAGYMGDDGSASMYIDLVSETFAVSSVSKTRHPIMPSVQNMFDVVRASIPQNG